MADKSKTFKVKRWKVITGLLLILPFAFVQWLLYSQMLVRLVAERAELAVPGLTITNLSGRIMTGVGVDAQYQDEASDVEIQNLWVEVNLRCLWRKKVCINWLSADGIDINIKPSPPPTQAPQTIALPTIELPIAVAIEQLQIAKLNISQQDQSLYSARDIIAELEQSGTQLSVTKLSLRDDYCQWNIGGQAQLNSEYPIDVQLSCQSDQAWGNVAATLSNTVGDLQVALKAQPQHPSLPKNTEVSAEITIKPLLPSLPLTASITSPNTLTFDIQSQQLELDNTIINLSSENMLVDVAAAADVLYNPIPGQHRVRLNASLNDAQRLTLQELVWQLPTGEVSAAGELAFAPDIQWRGDIHWQDIDIGEWQSAVTGRLQGKVQSQVQWSEQEGLQAQVTINELSGDINQQSLIGGGQLAVNNQTVSLNNVFVEHSNSRIRVAGIATPDQLDLNAEVDVKDLSVWLVSAAGKLVGQLQVKGSPNNPSISGKLVGNNIQYQSMALYNATAEINWIDLDNKNNRIDLVVQNGSYTDYAGDAQVTWRGSLAQHYWSLIANGLDQHQDKQLQLKCTGRFQQNRLQSDCDELNLAFSYFDQTQQFQLAQGLEFNFDQTQNRAIIEPFCLINAGQRLCSRNSIEVNNTGLSELVLQADNVGSQWLQPWLPKTMQVAGRVDAGLRLSIPNNALVVSAEANTKDASVTWQQNGTNANSTTRTNNRPASPLVLQIQTLAMDWQWQQAEQRHQFNWRFVTANNGRGTGRLALAERDIAGQINLQQWRLDAFSRFLLQHPRDRVQGLVNSQFTLTGSVDDPKINGVMDLQQGAVHLTVLPVPIDDISANLQVIDNLASLTGSFTANDSPGTLGGEFFWSPTQWHSELNLKATELAYSPEPLIQLTMSPDLNIKLSPELISLSGDIHVPRAQVEIKELPQQAVTVSSDTIIVGENTTENRQQISTNLRLILGDEVNFTGFGLETLISGNLTLRQQPGELLRGQGVLQLKQGRYQAYGQDLIIENGDLIFVNDIENPQLRLQAIRDPLKTADDVKVGLRVRGAARQPTPTLFSEPVLPQQSQMSYLLRGVAPGGQPQTDTAQLAAQSALSYALESKTGEGITRFAGRALGIEDLQVTTVSNEEGTQIGLSGYLTPKLLVRYGVGVFDTVNSLTLKYELKKNIYLEAVSGQSNALDILWSFKKD